MPQEELLGILKILSTPSELKKQISKEPYANTLNLHELSENITKLISDFMSRSTLKRT